MAVRETSEAVLTGFPAHPSAPVTMAYGATRLVYRDRPLVMGILNVTPDSFSDGGAYADPDRAVQRGEQIALEGADVIDIGGESTRPGSFGIPIEEELKRVIPVVKRLAAAVPVPLSVDTSKADVARQALEHGASLINDVTALRGDPAMAEVVAQHRAGLILMHMAGTPATMQQRPFYRDVVGEVAEFLLNAVQRAERAGIDRSHLLIDPGLGFGKTVDQNLELMQSLPRLTALGLPIVVGPSRKSFIGQTLHAEVQNRLAGTLACVAYAQRSGAHIIRVHDVNATVQLLQMLAAIERAPEQPRRRWSR